MLSSVRKSSRVRSAPTPADRKSTRLNSSHSQISYAVFCLKKKHDDRPQIGRVTAASITSRTPALTPTKHARVPRPAVQLDTSVQYTKAVPRKAAYGYWI